MSDAAPVLHPLRMHIVRVQANGGPGGTRFVAIAGRRRLGWAYLSDEDAERAAQCGELEAEIARCEAQAIAQATRHPWP